MDAAATAPPVVETERRKMGAITGALSGLLFGLFLAGGTGWLMGLVGLVVGAALGVLAVELPERVAPGPTRLAAGAAGFALAGAVAGITLDGGLLPALKSTPLVVWPVVAAGIAAFVAWVARNDVIRPAANFAAVGWLIGSFGVPDLGGGTRAEAMMALAVAGALAGLRYAAGPRTIASPIFKPFRAVVIGLAIVGAARLAGAYGTAESFDKLVTTIVAVILAVAVFTGLWVGLNLVFAQTGQHWSRFSGLLGFAVGFVLLAIIDGNRALQVLGPRESAASAFDSLVNLSDPLTLAVLIGASGWLIGRAVDRYQGEHNRLSVAFAAAGAALGAVYGRFYLDALPGEAIIRFVWWPIIGGALFAAVAVALSHTEDRNQRLAVGIGGGTAIGLLLGGTLKTLYQPAMQLVPLVAWPVGLAVVGAGLATVRKRPVLRPALAFALVGWVIGAFGVPDYGRATLGEALLAFGVAGALLGAIVGSTANPDSVGRAIIDARSRAWIFMGPALLFISAALVIPVIITTIYSFRGPFAEEGKGLANYREIFGNPDNFDTENWRWFFSSDLFRIGIVLAIVGVLLAVVQGRRTGRATDWSPQSGGIAVLGAVFLGFALFTTLRGTIINNLWWVFAVTLFSTGIGLAIAAWADGRKGEQLAKSIIFMPMAISFVGAAIIWRFMYRSQQRQQTGVLNAIWVWLGLKTSGTSNIGVGILGWELFDFDGRILFYALFAGLLAFFLYRAAVVLPHSGAASSAVYVVLAAAAAYLLVRMIPEGPIPLATGGFGGFAEGPTGEIVGDPILFLEDLPFKNFWLMVVLLWIETGFAMVILSAAIKAVPSDYIEAAKIDGADDTQVFWRIVVPQIAPTIGVVVTTIIVRVTKVYDIVKVMTNGRSDTNVLANEMINQAFQFRNTGLGSALAIVLFLSVLPIMYLNIRRMQKEAAA